MDTKRLLNPEEFSAAFPILIKDILGAPEFEDIPEMKERAAKIFQYNVPNNDLNL